MKTLRHILAVAALAVAGSIATAQTQLVRNNQTNEVNASFSLGANGNRNTITWKTGSTGVFASGSTLTVNGTFNGTPTGGTLNLSNMSLTLPAGAAVPGSRTISTTSPITGGGDLSGNRTIAIDDATTSTKGAASFNGTHFDVASGAVSIKNTTVTPGVYTNANITVGQDGRITLAGNGTGIGGNFSAVGNTLASSGNLTLQSAAGQNIVLAPGAGGSTVLGVVNVVSANVSALTGATANGELLIGDVSGNYVKAVPTGGAGVNIVTGPGSLAINSTDARNFIVNNVTITTNSTGNITFVDGAGVTLLGNNTTKSITVSASGGGNGTLSAGIGTLWPTASIASPPTGFFAAGEYGTAAQTALGDWSIIVASGGTVATPTADVAPGAVGSGTVVTFSSATPSLTDFRSTTNGTDPSYTVGTAGNSVTVTSNTTYEVVANRAGWVTSAVASFAYTVTAGVPTPSLLHWPLNDTAGTTITASVGPGSTTNTGTLNSDFLSMATGNGAFGSSSDITWGTNLVSVSFWHRRASYTGTAPIFRSGYINPAPRFQFDQNGSLTRVYVIGATGEVVNEYDFLFTLNTWQHVVAVYDNTTGTGAIKLYLDGSLATPTSTGSTKTGTANFATDTFYIKSIFSDLQSFDLDDLRIYSGELSGSEVTAIYSAGRP